MNRLFIVSLICFFPMAILGRMKEKTAPEEALKYYRASIMVFTVFLVCLAMYVYQQGGNFVKPMGTFY